ncbi:hypothetical protein N431DRAFT_370863 [Stipitochalara longipes BDJ]|nr:hypothetical protein N431DRAFT_370863 [Stipitochalara longipes BDJ]
MSSAHLSSNSRAVSAIVCATITAAIATVVVILRLITRWKILNFLGKDDWCIVIALFFSISNSITMVLQALWAFGRHFDTLSASQIDLFLHPFYFSIISYNSGLIFVKISILLLYLRIFHTSRLRYGCYILLGVVIAYGAFLILSSIFTCWPIARFWNKNIPGGCIPSAPLWYGHSAGNIVTDLAIFVLPLKTIYGLKLPRGQKISLCLVFTLGFFVCIISIVRIPSLYLAITTPDPTWNNIGISNWSCIEINAAITCASLSTLKPLVSRFFPNLLPSYGPEVDYQFSTYGDIEGSRLARGTVGGSITRTSSGTTVVQSDTDMIYKENFIRIEMEEEGENPPLGEIRNGST